MKTTFEMALGLAVAAALAGSAQATTVDFSDLIAPPDGMFVGPIYSEDGLTFDANSADADAMGSLSDDLNADPGGATLTHFRFSGVLTVTKTGGGGFFLKSFDLADAFNDGIGGTDGSLAFSYVDAGGLHESLLILDDTPGLQTFTFNLSGMTSFSLVNSPPFFQIDNIVYDEGCAIRAGCGVGGVPEPASWALMIAGFGLAGGALRRRRTEAA